MLEEQDRREIEALIKASILGENLAAINKFFLDEQKANRKEEDKKIVLQILFIIATFCIFSAFCLWWFNLPFIVFATGLFVLVIREVID